MIWIRTSISTVNFYTEYKINDKLSKTLPINSNCSSFFHLNIRSLLRSFGNLTNLFANIKTKFSFSIGITETWLRDKEHTVDIGGYNFVHNRRTNKAGGGVMFDDTWCAWNLCSLKLVGPRGKTLLLGLFIDLQIKVLMNY